MVLSPISLCVCNQNKAYGGIRRPTQGGLLVAICRVRCLVRRDCRWYRAGSKPPCYDPSRLFSSCVLE